METSAEANLLFRDASLSSSCGEETEAILARVTCPVLSIHGREDRCQPWERGERAAAVVPGGELLLLDGAGHLPQAREPVVVNRAIRRAVAAYPAAKALVPGLRMVVVTGPRIEPESLIPLPAADDLEVRGYVPDLYRHLAACDLAVVQGGLTTTMELTAYGRPFIYVPLRHHFEQNFHVRHRLDRYGAGRALLAELI